MHCRNCEFKDSQIARLEARLAELSKKLVEDKSDWDWSTGSILWH